MPAAAGVWFANIVIGAVTAAGTIATVGMATAAFYVGATVATLAVSFGLSKISAALMGRPKLGSGMQSRRTTIRDTTSPRTVLYGQATTGGVLVYSNTTGTKNEYFDMVIALAGHEITAITDVWFDDDKIANADINGGAAAGGVVGGTNKYAGVAWIYKYVGTDTQTASSVLTGAYTGEWTTDHRGRGVAYVHIRLRRDKEIYEQGAPQNFRFGFQGAKVYDPRKDTTNGGTGTHRIADPSTWEYSNNPALCVADYVIGGSITNSATRVNMRGFGASPDDVDWGSVIAAANLCDEDVTIPPASPATTHNRYECDGALSLGEAPAENLEQLLTSMAGQLVYSHGKYKLYAGAYDTAVLTLSESDLAGGVEYATGTPRGDRYNAVKGVRWDVTTGQSVEFTPKTSATYETADGGSRLYRDIELPFTVDEYRAQRIAQLILNRSREQQTLIWRGNLGCMRIGVWETVQVTVAELGLSGKVFRCIARDVQLDGEDAIVVLTLREENSATYTDPIVADYGDLTPVVPLPAPADYRNNIGFSVVDDPEFEWGTDGGDLDYWTQSSHVTYQDSDVAQIVLDGSSDAYVRTRSTTTVAKQLYGAWGIATAIRYRVTSALTGANQRMYLNVYASPKAFSEIGSTKDSLEIDLSGCTLNTWYTAAAVLSYEPAAGGTNYYCYVEARCESADMSAGIIEIDYLEGLKTAAPANVSANVAGTVPKVTAAAGKVLSDAGTWVTNGGGYPETDEETSAGVTIVNDTYPPGNVLRYGTNTTPGTTNMATAFNSASAVFDYYDIVIPPGTYLLSSQWTVTCPLYRRADISGYGAELLTSGAISALHLTGKATPHGVTVSGIKVNHRGSDGSGTGTCAAIAGFEVSNTDHAALRDCVVEANNTGTSYAAFLLHNGTASDNDTGAIWTTLENCTARKRAGADAGTIANCVTLRGAANGTIIRGCSFQTATTGVRLTYETGYVYIPNSVLIEGTAFESITTAILIAGASTQRCDGLRVVNNRFETCTTVLSLTGTTSSYQPWVPTMLKGNYVASDITTYINNPNDLYVNAHDVSITPEIYPTQETEFRWETMAGTAHAARFTPGGGNRGIRLDDQDGNQVGYWVWSGTSTESILAGQSVNLDIQQLRALYWGGTTGVTIKSGAGSPESVVTAPIGSLYLRSDGGTNTAVYRKESGTGSTGWVAISAGSSLSAANPTATVGTSAVNGSASTYMRSDAAPAISTSMAPTWTGTHTYNANTNWGSGYNIGYLASSSEATVAGYTIADYGITFGTQHTGWSGLGLSLQGYYGIAFATAQTLRLTIDASGVVKATGTVEIAGSTVAGASGTISLGSTTSSSATAGAATLPANPVGFLEIGINGTIRKVPYYA